MSPSRKPRRPRTERPSALGRARRTPLETAARFAQRGGQARARAVRRWRSRRSASRSCRRAAPRKRCEPPGVTVTEVATITGFPEIMDGRVKTLHPHIHGGLLAAAASTTPCSSSHGIGAIDLLGRESLSVRGDDGAPGLHRCRSDREHRRRRPGDAARRRQESRAHRRSSSITPTTTPCSRRSKDGGVPARDAPRARRSRRSATRPATTRRSATTCAPTARTPDDWPNPLLRSWQLTQPLRYGENPHQRAALYRTSEHVPGTVAHALQLQGKELSFNNLVDADAAYQAVKAFDATACVIVKHANPCGIATAAYAGRRPISSRIAPIRPRRSAASSRSTARSINRRRKPSSASSSPRSSSRPRSARRPAPRSRRSKASACSRRAGRRHRRRRASAASS